MSELLGLANAQLDLDEMDDPSWPTKLDSLSAVFMPSEASEPAHPGDNACTDWAGRPDLRADSYAQAAVILANWTLQSRACQDFLVYPILYLFRHYLELRLKELIVSVSLVLDKDWKWPTGHDLEKLWEEFLKLLRETHRHRDTGWDYVARCIRELSDVDRTSEAFRYERNKTGDQITLTQRKQGRSRAVTHINLELLARVMGRMVTFLDGASMAFDAELTYRAEREAEGGLP